MAVTNAAFALVGCLYFEGQVLLYVVLLLILRQTSSRSIDHELQVHFDDDAAQPALDDIGITISYLNY